MKHRHWAVLAVLLAGWGPPLPAWSQETRDGDDQEAYQALWNHPVTDFEFLMLEFAQNRDFYINYIQRQCAPDHPLRPEQLAELKKTAERESAQLVRAARAELWLFSLCRATSDRWQPSVAKVRLESMLSARISEKMMSRRPDGQSPFYRKWREIADPAQWEATRAGFEKWMIEHPQKDREAQAELRRLADGRLTEDEYRTLHIDRNGPTEILDLPVPGLFVYEDTWHYRVAAFSHAYRLTPEQQAAAQAILDDCVQRARAVRQRDDPEVRRLWKQLLTAYLDPKASQVPLHEALRQYRRVSQEAVRPIYEEMQRRLEAILTTEQKRRAGPPPPPPEWMRLMEIALADDDEPPATSRPTTQPATSPAPTPPADPPSTTRPADQPATTRPAADDGGGA